MTLVSSSFRKYALILFLLITVSSSAQTRISSIDTDRIHQNKVRKFLETQSNQGIVNFEDFTPSVTTQSDTSKFDYNVHLFSLEQTLPEAWKSYLTAHPSLIWQGKVIHCSFIYSTKTKKVIFPNDPYPGLEVGQLFFIEMRIFFGLVKFPVCFAVTSIDHNIRAITFSYVSSGPSKGSQTIRLNENKSGGTDIFHSSLHQTENVLRDKTLYPIYHKKAIKEVHQNIKNLINLN